MKSVKRKKIFIILLLVLFAASSLFIGVSDLTISDIFHDEAKRNLFFASRWPRLVSVIVVGAGMSITGVVMQQISGNRFVSPSTAGTLDFAKLGILTAIMLTPSASIAVKLLLAFSFALGGSWMFLFIINRIRMKDSAFIPIIGMMFGGIVSSVTTFIGYQFDLIQNIDSWLQGRFSLIITGRYELLLLGIPILMLIYFYADRFTIAGMGDSVSHSLGLNYRLTVSLGLILCSLMSAAVVVTVGTIPFIGVIIPNIVSIYMGDHIKKTLPYIALAGSSFLLICDTLGRVLIYPYEVSISVTTGTIGSAIFLYLILGRNKSAGKRRVQRGTDS